MSVYVQELLALLDKDKLSFCPALGITSADVRTLMDNIKFIVWSGSNHRYWIEDDEAFSNACVALGAFYISKRDGKPCVGMFSLNAFAENANFDFSEVNDIGHMQILASQAFRWFFIHYQRDLYAKGGFEGGMPKPDDPEGEVKKDPMDDLQDPKALAEIKLWHKQVNAAFHGCIDALPQPAKDVFLYKREGCTLEWLVENQVVRNISAAHTALKNAFKHMANCLKSKGIDQSDFLIEARVL